ncbi:hypothetical protein ACS0TY_021607 [Phlomoides rotata]
MKGHKRSSQGSALETPKKKKKTTHVVEQEEPSIKNNEETVVTSETKKSSQSSKVYRGPCEMHSLEQLRRRGGKKNVELDE